MDQLLPPFAAPRLKHQWALGRMAELAAAIEAYNRDVVHSVQRHEGGFTIDRTDREAWEIPLILGDAVHNLRTSLDLLAADLARLNNRSVRSVYFPFAEDAEGLKEQIKRKKFNRAGTEAMRLLKELKPYRGGNALLRALHDLDVMDKHQLIIPVFHAALVKDLVLTGPGGRMVIDHLSGPGTGFSISSEAGDFLEAGSMEAVPAFGPLSPEPLRGHAVLPALHRLAENVADVIEAFAALTGGGAR